MEGLVKRECGHPGRGANAALIGYQLSGRCHYYFRSLPAGPIFASLNNRYSLRRRPGASARPPTNRDDERSLFAAEPTGEPLRPLPRLACAAPRGSEPWQEVDFQWKRRSLWTNPRPGLTLAAAFAMEPSPAPAAAAGTGLPSRRWRAADLPLAKEARVTATALAILISYGVIVTLWKAMHLLMLFYKPSRYFLGRRSTALVGDQGPRVSILLAAKDEAGNIGDCVRSVLSSSYTNFELIVIDDRSCDGTAEEAVQAAAGDPRVKFIWIQSLPEGWTGKMHAIRQGLEVAEGEIILIMDADTRHTPQTLGTALAHFQRKNIHLLSLLPRFEHPSWFSKMVQPLVGTLLLLWKPLPWVNSKKRPQVAFGWGGFLMIRRRTLEEVGGLEAVRNRFAADIALVGLVKKARHRVRVLHAPKLLSTFLYRRPAEVIRGWSRLLRITADNQPGPLLWTLALLVGLCLSAYLALGIGLAELVRGGHGELALLLGGMGLMHLVFQLSLFGRFYKISGNNPWYAVGHLPAVLVAGFLTVLALARIRSGQMNWRGTQYQLTHDGGAGRTQ
jgi:glycosyltransferase involved in cell wall biosynthesis